MNASGLITDEVGWAGVKSDYKIVVYVAGAVFILGVTTCTCVFVRRRSTITKTKYVYHHKLVLNVYAYMMLQWELSYYEQLYMSVKAAAETDPSLLALLRELEAVSWQVTSCW